MLDLKNRRSYDSIGIVLSSLCAIHCVVTSFFMMSLPILARYYIANPFIHIALAVLVIPVGFFAFYRGFQRHKRTFVLVVGILGVLIVGLIPQLTHFLHIRLNEPVFLMSGSLILIVGHILNSYSVPR